MNKTEAKNRIEKLRKQIALQELMLHMTQAQKQVYEALKESAGKYSNAEIANITAEIDALIKKNKLYEDLQGISDSITSSMENSFLSIIDGTQTVGKAFKSLAADIIKELYKVLIVQRLVGTFDVSSGTGSGLVGFLGKIFSGLGPKQANGGVWNNGMQMTAFAKGGVVSSPTMFGTSSGAGLMGEAGPEAIMPLTRGPDGRLGVSSLGHSKSESTTIVNHIEVHGGGDVTAIRTEILKAVPHIVEKTKAAVIDARRRGGQMKEAFR